MREIHKNPMLYYVLIPVLVGLWPLLVWAVYLPDAEQSRQMEGGLCAEGQTHVIEILRIDPDRPDMTGKGQISVEFDYGIAADRAAMRCGIANKQWSCDQGGISVSGGKKRRGARVKLTDVKITQAAEFLSNIQSTWVNLTCESIKLTKKKQMPDQWDVDLSFVYYY